MAKTQYSEQIDTVIYGNGTDDFGPREWLQLAMAALDQAGRIATAEYERVAKLLEEVA